MSETDTNPESPQKPSSASSSTPCSASFDSRLTSAIAYRQLEIECSAEMKMILNDADHPEHADTIKLAVNQLTNGLGLCQLAGMSIKEMLMPWVEAMEKAHPKSLGQNIKITDA